MVDSPIEHVQVYFHSIHGMARGLQQQEVCSSVASGDWLRRARWKSSRVNLYHRKDLSNGRSDNNSASASFAGTSPCFHISKASTLPPAAFFDHLPSEIHLKGPPRSAMNPPTPLLSHRFQNPAPTRTRGRRDRRNNDNCCSPRHEKHYTHSILT